MKKAASYVSTLGWSRERWLKERHNLRGIGGSDIAAVLGLNPYQTPRELYEIKIAENPPEEVSSPIFDWGTDLEDFLQSRYKKLHPDHTVVRDNKIRFGVSSRWFVNLDRIVRLPDGSHTILELKTTTSNAMKYWDSEMPLMYVAQVQWAMYITRMRRAVLGIAVLDKRQFLEFPIEYDAKFVQYMSDRALEFLEMMDKRTPPPMVLKDVEALTTIDPNTVVQADEEIAGLIPLYHAAQSAEALASKTKNEIAEKIKMAIGEKAALVKGDTVLATYKVVSRKECVIEASQYRQLSVRKVKGK